MKLIAVVTTVGNLAEARSIGRALVEQRLPACAQISEIESFYVWDDAVQNEQEFRVLCKITDARYQAIEEVITKRHSYDLPAIHTFTLDRVYGAYTSWIEKSCSES